MMRFAPDLLPMALAYFWKKRVCFKVAFDMRDQQAIGEVLLHGLRINLCTADDEEFVGVGFGVDFLSNINGLCQITRNVTTGQIAIFQLRGDHNIGAIGQGTSNLIIGLAPHNDRMVLRGAFEKF